MFERAVGRLWNLDSPVEPWGDTEPPATPRAARLLNAGYEWDGAEFCRITSRRVRRARKAHHGITVGQRYEETTTVCVDEDGNSRRVRTVRALS